MQLFTDDGKFIAPKMPGKLEDRFQEIARLVERLSPDELGLWLDLVRFQYIMYTVTFPAQQAFISMCLAQGQKLYAETHNHRYYEYT